MVIPAITLAGLVAMCNGLSSAQLAANHPISGGTYEWTSLTIQHLVCLGWMFLFAKFASAATAALGFAWYIYPEGTLAAAITLVVAVLS